MGLLADFQALNGDDVQLATLNGNVVTANTALTNAEAAVTAQNTTISVATMQVVTDLQAAPYNGFAVTPDPNNQPNGFLLLTIVAAVPPATQAGLSIQPVTLAS